MSNLKYRRAAEYWVDESVFSIKVPHFSILERPITGQISLPQCQPCRTETEQEQSNFVPGSARRHLPAAFAVIGVIDTTDPQACVLADVQYTAGASHRKNIVSSPPSARLDSNFRGAGVPSYGRVSSTRRCGD